MEETSGICQVNGGKEKKLQDCIIESWNPQSWQGPLKVIQSCNDQGHQIRLARSSCSQLCSLQYHARTVQSNQCEFRKLTFCLFITTYRVVLPIQLYILRSSRRIYVCTGNSPSAVCFLRQSKVEKYFVCEMKKEPYLCTQECLLCSNDCILFFRTTTTS